MISQTLNMNECNMFIKRNSNNLYCVEDKLYLQNEGKTD